MSETAPEQPPSAAVYLLIPLTVEQMADLAAWAAEHHAELPDYAREALMEAAFR